MENLTLITLILLLISIILISLFTLMLRKYKPNSEKLRSFIIFILLFLYYVSFAYYVSVTELYNENEPVKTMEITLSCFMIFALFICICLSLKYGWSVIKTKDKTRFEKIILASSIVLPFLLFATIVLILANLLFVETLKLTII